MKKIFPFLIIYLVVTVLYYPVFTTYFSQDDFFHFKVSQTDGTLTGFLNLFGFHPFEERGIAFYRPIFREVLFNTFYNTFGLNHIPFRILSFLIHFINIYLVYILMQKLFQKNTLSFFAAFFYGISSAHIASLYYLSGGIQALGATMFILLTLLLVNKFPILSFLTFLLALSSHELAIITPVILFILRPNIFRLLPFFLLSIIYLYLEITVIGFSSKELQYTPVFNLKTILNSLAWYAGWALGLPEMLVDFVLPGLRLNPTLMRYWGTYYILIFASFVVAVAILGFTAIYSKQKILLDRKFLVLLVWFPAGLVPVLLLPLHKSAYYLAPVLPAFWGSIGYIIFKYPRLSLLIVFISAIFLLNTTSILLGHSTYWAAQRGKVAEKLIHQIKSEYPTLPRGAVIYVENDPNYPFVAKEWGGSSKQAAFILNGSDALQLLYQDPTLQVFYEDLEGIPQDLPEDKLYTIVARIN